MKQRKLIRYVYHKKLMFSYIYWQHEDGWKCKLLIIFQLGILDTSDCWIFTG